MRRHVARSAVAVVVLVVVTGCGIGASERVEEIQPDELAALDPTTTSTTTTSPAATSEPSDTMSETGVTRPPESGPISTTEVSSTPVRETTTTVETEDIELYFINGSQLVAIATPVPSGSSLRGQLRGLESGLPSNVADDGIRTAVPVGLIDGVLINGDQTAVTVDLDSELLASVESADQQPMVAQIVLSLTGGLGYREVRFTLDDVPMRVFRRDNLRSEPGEPVTWADYEALLEGEGNRSESPPTSSP